MKRSSLHVRCIAVLVIAFCSTSATNAELVVYYDYDAGTAADQSGLGNHGGVGAGISFSTNTPLPAGLSLRGTGVGGTAGVVTVTNTPSIEAINHQLSLSMWIRANSADNANWFRFMIKGTQANGDQSWMWNRNNTTQDTNMRVDTIGASGAFNQNRGDDGDVVLDGTWHQLVFTLNNGTWAEYLDGQASGSGSYKHGNGLSNAQPLYIAGRAGGDNITGMLDDVGVWDHALSPSQARSIHQFATEASLGYNVGQVNMLFTLALGEETKIEERVWRAVDGLTQPEGDLIINGDQYEINFGGGEGVISLSEKGTVVLIK